MFLFALFPAVIAVAMFFGSLRQRNGVQPTTKAQREYVAATAREYRALIGRSLLMFALFALPLAALAGVRVFGSSSDLRPLVLK